MTLLVILTLCTLIASLFLVIPFLRTGSDAARHRDAVVDAAQQQLAQLDNEAANGLIGADEVRLARQEIERRVLAVAKEGEADVRNGSEKVRIWGVAIAVGWVAVGSAVLYSFVGRPDLPVGRVSPALVATNATSSANAPAATQQAVGSVDDMIAGLAARLEENPDDAAGWQMLGWSYFQTENYRASVDAYAKAVELDASDPVILSVYGEALVRLNEGEVSDRAMGVFHQALALDPTDPRARFFQGMALEQRGDPKGAVTLWLEILDKAPADADWAPGLRARIEELAPAAGIDLAQVPEWQTAPEPASTELRGPSAQEIASAQQMSAEDRQSMIRGMVEGLAARLEDNPNDPAGWARLIRSYSVLGDMDAAGAALGRARVALGDGSDAFARVAAGAAELGLR